MPRATCIWDFVEMELRELIKSGRFSEAITELQRDLARNPEDMAAIEGMALVLRAKGEYREALSFFERLADHRDSDETANLLAPGSAAWRIDTACLHWLFEDRPKAVHLMHGLAAGILDGSIRYGDAGGGMSQGLLLFYKAITSNLPGEASFALDYLRNRVKRSLGQIWPAPVAQYCLGDISFDVVMEAVNRQPMLAGPLAAAKQELGRRRRLCVALFHAGVKCRVRGDEQHCLSFMRECCALENPLIEQEWYLARFEVEGHRAD
jgi:tetratricopeptide (TPR) repeat protein